jgi:hypothetical protein
VNKYKEVPLHNANKSMMPTMLWDYKSQSEMLNCRDSRGQTPLCKLVANDDVTGATFLYRHGVRDTCSALGESKKAMLHYLSQKFGK